MRVSSIICPSLGHSAVLLATLIGATVTGALMPRLDGCAYAEDAPAAGEAPADESASTEEDSAAASGEPVVVALDENEPAEAVATDAPKKDPPKEKESPTAEAKTEVTTPDAQADAASDTDGDADSEPTTPAVMVGDQPGMSQPAKTAPPVEVPAPKVEVEVATFNGAKPGKITRQELEVLWGKPKDVDDSDPDGVQLQYTVAPFEEVTAVFKKDVLATILVQLEKAFPAAPLAKELQLDDVEPALVSDEFGEPLGLAYPERGVIFTFAAGQKEQVVGQIMIEQIDPQTFVVRAERHARARYRSNLADLDYALSVDPECVRAHVLRARILLEVGNFPEAKAAIAEAVKRDSENAEYRLLQAKIWEQQGDSEGALAETRAALGLAEKNPVWKAAAVAQLGDQIAAGADRDYKQASTYHQQAIRIAQPLVSDRRVAVRDCARQVLLDAHLAMANDIAWGAWKNKATAVPQWLKRAEKLISDSESQQDDVLNARFQLCQQALAAYVGLQGKLDPTPWIDLAAENGATMIETADDPLARQRIQWELGMAYYDALQVYHMRRAYSQALAYGGKAVTYLEEAVAAREPIPGQAYLMGRLYFRLGSIHAAEKKDRAQAIPWFDKAVPLMEEPIPQTAMADIGRQGETFVSMAVSYWEAGQSDEAMRLTEQGLKLIEQAVEEEILDRTALAIPYSNLADMHRQLGDEAKAKSFAEMAAQIQSQKRR